MKISTLSKVFAVLGVAVAFPAFAQFGGWGRGRTETTVIHCKSTDYRYNTCSAPGRVVSVSVSHQDSHSACNQGSSYGATGDSIWVDKGCEADFRVEYSDRGNGGGGWGGGGHGDHDNSTVVTCSSNQERYARCDVGGRIESVRVRRQLSDRDCVQGVSYGYDNDSIWVDRGCRAEFDVELRGRGGFGGWGRH